MRGGRAGGDVASARHPATQAGGSIGSIGVEAAPNALPLAVARLADVAARELVVVVLAAATAAASAAAAASTSAASTSLTPGRFALLVAGRRVAAKASPLLPTVAVPQ